MTEDTILRKLPIDEVEYILDLHKESLKEDLNGVSARLMKELSLPMLKIIEEEFNKDESNCVLGMLSFFVNITGNVIMQTVLMKNPDISSEMIKKAFCILMDQAKRPLREFIKSHS